MPTCWTTPPASIATRSPIGERLPLVVGDVERRSSRWRRAPCAARLRSRARSWTSRLLSGSSSRTSRGSRTSARARATRCRSPPERLVGLRLRCSVQRTSCRGLRYARVRPRRRAAGGRPARSRCFRRPKGGGAGRGAGTPCRPGVRPAVSAVTSSPVDADHALVRDVEPGDDAQQRRLAASRRTEDGDDLAGGDVEVDAGEHLTRSSQRRMSPSTREPRRHRLALRERVGRLLLQGGHELQRPRPRRARTSLPRSVRRRCPRSPATSRSSGAAAGGDRVEEHP